MVEGGRSPRPPTGDFMQRFAHLAALLACAALTTPAAAQRPYTPEITIERYVSTHELRSNGSDRETTEYVARIETEQGVSDAGVERIGFRNDIDVVESLEASTIEPDGTEIKVPASAIRTQDEDSSGGATDFSDTKYKAIVFPAVQVGSRVRYVVTVNHRSTAFPRFFEEYYVLAPQYKWEYWEANIVVPTDLPIFVEQRGIAGGLKSTAGGMQHYRYSYRGPNAKAPESGSVWAGDYAPSLSVSTYPDAIAVGNAFERGAAPMAKVTDAIQLLANDLTKGLTTDADKVKTLDHWVAKNIRYVAVFLGHGGLIPHPADQVLANRYGDCKDHAILMQSLLTAVGIKSSAALVNLGSAYHLSRIGTIAPTNHVITYVPSLDLYVDSTDEFAHSGSLAFEVMDKPTVLTALGALGRTPRMLAKENSDRAEISMLINPDGTIDGKTVITPSGMYEADARADRFSSQSAPEEQVIKKMLNRFNETGAGSLEYPDPTVLDQTFWVKSSYQLDPVTNFPGPGAMMIPIGVSPGGIANFGVHKPVQQRDWQYPCISRRLEDNYEIHFPPNVQLGPMPPGVVYDVGDIHYHASYEVSEQIVRIHREIEIQHQSDVCTPQDNDAWKLFHPILQRDLRSQIFYK